MEVTWIEHNGRKVLFSNYEGCKTSEEMIGILYKEAEILMGQEGKVLVMANYEKSFGSNEYMDALKMEGMTQFNVIYADQKGNIFYQNRGI